MIIILMFEVRGKFNRVHVDLSIEKLSRFPYFVNTPSSFRVSPYAVHAKIFLDDELILDFYSLVSIKAYWTEYPEHRRIDGNATIILKNLLEKKLTKEELDFAIKSITSYSLSFQSVDAIEKKTIMPVPYVVKTKNNEYSVFVFCQKLGTITFECEDKKCIVLLEGKKVDELYLGIGVRSKYPQIENLVGMYVDEDFEPDDSFFGLLAKKYAALLLRKEIRKIKSFLFS